MTAQVTLSRKVHFSCGHRYYLEHWSEEKNQSTFGDCSSIHGHGHNYLVDVSIGGDVHPETGMIVDLVELDSKIKEVVELLDHKFLNTDVPFFLNNLPTTENIATFIGKHLQQSFQTTHYYLKHLALFENESLWVEISY